ncbi:MAG TPA: cobyrinate a,c-diamide synthase [Ectothiorhodospiraceae bacterium]|nr:cobyrinate a,c-diamide synthase [Ectothiorhodospiraceae bacterium]
MPLTSAQPLPRLLFSAPHKSSGKTTITIGVCAALRGRDVTVQPYKKGPDYIDPMWLGQAAQQPCYNLDFNVQSRDEISAFFSRHSENCALSIIEGNMGLFDSVDLDGSTSNAELAALLDTPVILIINVEGATRSIVPIIQGFIGFESKINIAGVILNNIAGKRHEERLRKVINHYIDIPIVGAIHRNPDLVIDERHLGLVPSNESHEVDAKVAEIARIVEAQVDLNLLLKIADSAPQLHNTGQNSITPLTFSPLRIGIAQDAAFGFYYPDDLEQFIELGAELIPFSPLVDQQLPERLDGLFIGGGFPETHLAQLDSNQSMKASIAVAIESGLPCYAECGGLMYLSQGIEWQGEAASMVGVIPANCRVHKKPVGRGYARMETSEHHPWPFVDIDGEFPAHEFHYSELDQLSADYPYAYRMIRGKGINGQNDGVIYKNLLANYIHLRSVGLTPWVQHFLTFVAEIRDNRLQSVS